MVRVKMKMYLLAAYFSRAIGTSEYFDLKRKQCTIIATVCVLQLLSRCVLFFSLAAVAIAYLFEVKGIELVIASVS